MYSREQADTGRFQTPKFRPCARQHGGGMAASEIS